MDEPDIPMLDVGDFEVLDECVGEDDNEDDQDIRSCDGSYYGDEEEHGNSVQKIENVQCNERDNTNIDENSGDNTDNILDVSIDVSENEFLENVAKDFSENIEDDVEEHPQKAKFSGKKGQPTVQIKKIVMNTKKSDDDEPEIISIIPKKKPGPKSKTMNVQSTPTKKSIKKINYTEKEVKKDENNENQKPSNGGNQKNIGKSEQNVQNKTPAFLKKDLTDEEIMIHFDEIENTVLTSDSFVIQNDVDQAEKEKIKGKYYKDESQDNNKKDSKNEENKDEANANEDIKEVKDNVENEEENWDESETDSPVKAQMKIEEEELKESEMWYKEKIKAKENTVEEKFTKLAKIIQYSYPMYKKWLDKNESLYGTAICKVESSKHSPLDQLHPSRWKFICNKKQNQQSSKEEEKQADNTSDNKNVQLSWQMIPGVQDANLDDPEEYPPFVMHVVKIFEEFLQSLETFEEKKEIQEVKESGEEVNTEETSEDKEKAETSTEKKETNNQTPNENDKSLIKNLDGLTVLLRCNRKKDLMMHITGKNISTDLMDKIKDLFENGPGKDSNVKSVYVKTINKENNVLKTNTTFLLGSETLDDNIGPVKVQLAPQANVWVNLSGVEVLANVISEYLVPTKKTSVLEIGCGTGVISLLLASKCEKVIGLDVQKEIVEAEITCELNGIKNASFMTGKPKVVMSQIDKALANSKAVAILNTNNTFGRSLEVICALRKMSTLGRIVVITTLTKQAIRSILELTQPADSAEYGNPFIPIKACIVDTTPKGYGFDIVMSMERRTLRNLLKISPVRGVNNPIGLISKSKQVALKQNAGLVTNPHYKKGLPIKFLKSFKAKSGFITGKKFFQNSNFAPNKFQGKRPYPGGDSGSFHSGAKKFKQFDKPWLGPNVRVNPMHDKKLRDIDQGDLREKLSSNRVEPTILAQEMQEQKKLLDAAKEKLTGVGSSVDGDTVKKLQEMLNLAIEKTNKLQSQLPPRSVWDRIAPVDTGLDEEQFKNNPPMKGRLVKETGPKEIIITTSNTREFEAQSSGSAKNKKYENIPPLEPNLIMPVDHKQDRLKMTQPVQQKPNTAPYQKPSPNRFQGGNYRKQENPSSSESWNRGKPQSSYSQNEPQEKWNRPSPPRRSSPPRPLLMSPPRQASPLRRPISPARRPLSPPRRPLSPSRRPISPNYRQHSSSSRNLHSGGRQNSPPRRHNSPPRRSPPRQNIASSRQKSPPSRRFADEGDIPNRGAIAETGWSRRSDLEKEKSSWQNPLASSSASNWNQRYRSDNDKWDNNAGAGSWNNKNSLSAPTQSNPNNRWKSASNASNSGTNWDVQKKDTGMRDLGRHESRHDSRHESRNEPRHDSRHDSRHEPRHESRHEQRWEPIEKSFRNEKDDWGDLPEDARDPWGDDNHPSSSQKDMRWNNQPSHQSQQSNWPRDKLNDNWQTKQNYPLNNMGSGGNSLSSNLQNPNMNMNMGMNNPSKSVWQTPPQQQQPQQSNRNQNWLPPGNWQSGGSTNAGVGGGSGSGVGLGSLLLGNTMNNWQSSPQHFSNFPSRPFNNNPFMNNRR